MFSFNQKYDSDQCFGTGCDTGAQYTVSGRTYRRLGSIQFISLIPVGPKNLCCARSASCAASVLGLVSLDQHKLKFFSLQKRLAGTGDKQYMPQAHVNGQICFCWPKNFTKIFTKINFGCLHSHFMHSEKIKLFKLLYREYSGSCNEEMLNILAGLWKAHQACQRNVFAACQVFSTFPRRHCD